MSAGTLKLVNKSKAVIGTGTGFTSDLKAADFIVVTVGGVTYSLVVSSVESNTELTLLENFDGPSVDAAAWTAVPYGAQMRMAQQLGTDISRLMRYYLMDKNNWNAVLTGPDDVTVTLPDGTQFTGPSWPAVVDTVKKALQLRGELSSGTDLNSVGVGKEGVWYQSNELSALFSLNYPEEGKGGSLEVLPHRQGVMQRYTSQTKRVYLRVPSGQWNGVDGPWSSWLNMSDTSGIDFIYPSSGGISTSLSDLLAQKVSVTMFGAKGDGKTVCTSAVKAAMGALSGGGVVYFPRGKYVIGNVPLVSGVSFCGESSDSTTLTPAGQGLTIFDDSNNKNGHGMISHIEKLSFDCGDTKDIVGIKSIDGNRLKIDNINFYGCAVNIELDKGGNHKLSNILSAPSSGNKAGQLKLWSSSDDRYGAVFTSVENYRVEGGSVVPAIYLRRAVGLKFTNLFINDNTFSGIGIVVENDSQGIMLQGIVVGTGVGLVFQKGGGIDKSPICNITTELDFDQCMQGSIQHNAGRVNSFRGGMITSSDVGVDTKAVFFGSESYDCSIDGTYITGYYGAKEGGTCILLNGAKGTQIRNVHMSGSQQGVAVLGNCSRSQVIASDATDGVIYPSVGDGTGVNMAGLKGYRPTIGKPAASPSNGVLYTNNYSIAVRVAVFASSIDSIEINGYAMGYTSGSHVELNPGETIKVNSGASLNWAWAPVFR